MEQVEAEKGKTIELRAISEKIAIGSIPVIGFILSYLYELGNTSIFNIPYQFIFIDLKDSILPVLFISMIILLIYLKIFEFMKKTEILKVIDGLYQSMAIISIIISLINLVNLYSCSTKTIWNWQYVFLPIFVAILMYGFRVREKKNPINPGERKKRIYMLIILLLVLIKFFAFSTGSFFALHRVNYLTFHHEETRIEMVVLRKYGGSLICAPFNRKTKEVYKSFYFINFRESPNIRYRAEKIGPLKSIYEHPKPIVPLMKKSKVVKKGTAR